MITVKQVTTKKEQKAFLDFPLDLYAGNPCFVPPLYMDEKKIFRPDYVYSDCCDFVCFLAYKDGAVAGRIMAIIQKAFCRFDAIDDFEVSKALFEAAEKWAKDKGMDTVCGPLNFSDLEREGLLIEGFDQQATFEENYNAPYYGEHIERLGYEKEVDWVGFRLYGAESPEAMAELEQLSDFIFRRYKLHLGPSKSGSDFLKRYADGIFELIDKSYEGLYGTVPFTEGMRKLMLENFKLVVDPKYVAVVLDENDRMVCFGITFPALAGALAGGRGKLTPGTALRLLKALKKPDAIDLCLVGVDPEYANRGVSAVFSVAIMKMLRDNPRLRFADTNLNLEDNYAILNQWKRFRKEQVKRYRSYVKRPCEESGPAPHPHRGRGDTPEGTGGKGLRRRPSRHRPRSRSHRLRRKAHRRGAPQAEQLHDEGHHPAPGRGHRVDGCPGDRRPGAPRPHQGHHPPGFLPHPPDHGRRHRRHLRQRSQRGSDSRPPAPVRHHGEPVHAGGIRGQESPHGAPERGQGSGEG